MLLQQREVEFLVILLNPAKISETWVPPKEMGSTGSTLGELETPLKVYCDMTTDGGEVYFIDTS